MKRLLILILITIVCKSCTKQSNESEQDEFEFTYSVDTVMIDSGDEFIYLNSGLRMAALSPDKNLLYNYNHSSSEIEVIDLGQLKLTNRIKMEKEGPNGTGNPSSITISLDGRFFFATNTEIREFNAQLDSMKQYKFNGKKFEVLNSDETINSPFVLSPDGKFALVNYGPIEYFEVRNGISALNLADFKLKKFPLELFERSDPYHISFSENGQIRLKTIESMHIDPIDHRVLISSHNFNEAYLLDLISDSLTRKIFDSKLTQNIKQIPARSTANSREEFHKLWNGTKDYVEFGRFYYDDFNEKFWRFSQDLDRKIGDSAVYKQITTIFDKNLNQLHEEVIPIPYYGFKFFKNGKLYSYINVEDELGFAVFTFDF
ncbi:protein of unknown function [Algoriphagus locisalis]|uniref:DUF4221 domain-containing protein n=1 Tax=Algoriphagus locisalis TaxID=305507 RepID=A0A1I7AN99_9BACT|nr:DUF4221 family protein [Algoriphagus locisalis]SFT76451.1 protein of unknown function [Algoriphagus locisalis]